MGSEVMLVAFGMGTLVGWVVLNHVARRAPQGRDEAIDRSINRPDPEKALRDLASLGLSHETSRWILRTMAQAGSNSAERTAGWISLILGGAEGDVHGPLPEPASAARVAQGLADAA